MALREVKYSVDNDGAEMIDFLGEVIDAVKAGGADAYMALFPGLMKAAEGYQNAINAAKGDGRNELIQYSSAMLLNKFAPDDAPEELASEEPSAPAPAPAE